MALSRFVLTANVTVSWPGTWSEITGGEADTPVTTPAVPSSTVAADNGTGVTVAVTVTGGTVTVIAVSGTATGLTSGTVIVPYPGTITLTYSAAPTWAWAPAELPQSGTGGTAGVSGTAPPAGQAGTIPQYTFISGTAIYADSSGGTNGACQLYSAIGAGNLRAFIDGQDDVGHAGLSNLEGCHDHPASSARDEPGGVDEHGPEQHRLERLRLSRGQRGDHGQLLGVSRVRGHHRDRLHDDRPPRRHLRPPVHRRHPRLVLVGDHPRPARLHGRHPEHHRPEPVRRVPRRRSRERGHHQRAHHRDHPGPRDAARRRHHRRGAAARRGDHRRHLHRHRGVVVAGRAGPVRDQQRRERLRAVQHDHRRRGRRVLGAEHPALRAAR